MVCAIRRPRFESINGVFVIEILVTLQIAKANAVDRNTQIRIHPQRQRRAIAMSEICLRRCQMLLVSSYMVRFCAYMYGLYAYNYVFVVCLRARLVRPFVLLRLRLVRLRVFLHVPLCIYASSNVYGLYVYTSVCLYRLGACVSDYAYGLYVCTFVCVYRLGACVSAYGLHVCVSLHVYSFIFASVA